MKKFLMLVAYWLFATAAVILYLLWAFILAWTCYEWFYGDHLHAADIVTLPIFVSGVALIFLIPCFCVLHLQMVVRGDLALSAGKRRFVRMALALPCKLRGVPIPQ